MISSAVRSRHTFVWLPYSQTQTALIASCEAAWAHIVCVFKVLIPNNPKAVVTNPDAVNPQLPRAWLDYAEHVGFGAEQCWPLRSRSWGAWIGKSSKLDRRRLETRQVEVVRGTKRASRA